MTPPGPPAKYPPADQELPPGPPAGYPRADQELPPGPPADHTPQPTLEHGASEHVLLTLDDLPELRRRGQPNAQTLHDEARHWTNLFGGVQAEFAAGVQADLAAQWENWKVYIAKHKNADAIVGPGVVSFTATPTGAASRALI